MIVFYDIPSKVPGKAWSPNTWKARFVLNFKGVPYKTEWIEFPDIEPRCKALEIPPTSTKADGAPFYTLPAIHDPTTGAYVSESLSIAEYLEKTYPDTPAVFPCNTLSLQAPFHLPFRAYLKVYFQFGVPAAHGVLNAPSAEYFRRTREASFGKTLEELLPQGDRAKEEWAKVQEGMGKVSQWYEKNGGKGPFLLGETASWADLFVASYLVYMRITWGEERQEWKEVMSWHGGQWRRLLEALEKYTTVH
ncbi:hypothetical protein CVT26_008585 [Gymnopilus dilepis]|uniref:GST N-terminal domain-containing protein n=1 Tax=Gymnopilus dilepis TaxID=231916 RepID=A0A409XXR8_9AGAR|nr:hypothetical protein CVT26_008585 [Gymnopilus dilepis]